MADNESQEVVEEPTEVEQSSGESGAETSVEEAKEEGESGSTAEEEPTETEGESMESKEAEKSVSVADLIKAVNAYEAVEDTLIKSGTNRETFLQARLDSGTITKSERVELGKIWAGQVDETETLSKSVNSKVESDGNSELIDASDFLKSIVGGIDSRMDKVEGEILRDGLATRELMKAQGTLLKGLAGVLSEQDDLIKSLVNRLEAVEGSPAPKRSVSTDSGAVAGRGISKSVVGETAPGPVGLTNDQIHGGLRGLMTRAGENKNKEAMDRIVQATALYEQTGNLPDNMMQAIRQISAS